VKTWLKIALNDVRLPKFEEVNGKSRSPRKMVVKDLRQRSMLTYFAHAQRAVFFLAQGHTLFWQITPFVLIVAPQKLYSGWANRGRGFQICAKKLPLRIGHVIRRMRSGCKRTVNDILSEMSELRTQERIALGSSNLMGVLTT